MKTDDKLINALNEFKRIAGYLEPLLQVRFSDENISNSIRLSSFDRLKKIEQEQGFVESVENLETGKKETFFNLGPNNDWRNILNENLAAEITREFKFEMKELGYLNI